jgi:hypothetical protein
MARVHISLTPERARDLQQGLADLNCWTRGYVCALPADDRLAYGPMGISEARDINIILKGAIGDHEDGKDPVDDALIELMRTASAACNATKGRGDKVAYEVAAHLHDEIVNLRRKLKGDERLADTAPWPFGDRS